MNSKPPFFYKLSSQPDIFTAWRDGYYSFYYRGNSLFEYRNGRFTTHQKFALLFPEEPQYVCQKANFSGRFSSNFEDDLEQIKNNVKRQNASEERIGVSFIACQNSFQKKQPVVVLDIEKAIPFAGKSDELDLVLLKDKSLRFVEAKTYSNKDVFSKRVFFDQVEQYQRTIQQHKKSLLEYYRTVVENLNLEFQLKLQMPEEIKERIVVLIFGYEKVQYDNRLQPLLQSNELKDYLYYAVGDYKHCSVERLFDGKSCG